MLFIETHNRILYLMQKYGEPLQFQVHPFTLDETQHTFSQYGNTAYVSPATTPQPTENASQIHPRPSCDSSILGAESNPPALSPEPCKPSLKTIDGNIKVQSVVANHGGYFPAQVRSGNNRPVFSLILLDTGNNIKYDGAVKKDFAEKLNCNILSQPMQIGLAAESVKIQACGITNHGCRNSKGAWPQRIGTWQNISD